MTLWQQILWYFAAPAGSSLIVNIIWQRYRRPQELHKEISDLGKQIVILRGQIKYIEGRLNGRHWRTE